MTNISSFEEAIKQATSWRSVEYGDPNTIDVYDHAKKVSRDLHLQLPAQFPRKEISVKIVELVNEKFIKGRLIRERTSKELVELGKQVADSLQEQNLLPFGRAESYVVALYIWHGCICMAKTLRKTYVVGRDREASYTIKQRQQGYEYIRQCWQEEEAIGNPWVKYGVSLAKIFEKGEKVDDWVPEDSPYWDD